MVPCRIVCFILLMAQNNQWFAFSQSRINKGQLLSKLPVASSGISRGDEYSYQLDPPYNTEEDTYGNPLNPLNIPAYLPPSQRKINVEKPSNAFEINFCDRVEFPDDVLSMFNLERVDYFIWNGTCSSTFFQCSVGYTFLLRCPSEDQAFDRTTVNCNFKHSVKVCPEYDHVMHCTISANCSDTEFACCSMPQKCLPLNMRCDGHSDCSDGDDENNCPSCARNEFACVKSSSCIPASKRCDGIVDDCADGSNFDEIDCNRNSTCVGKFMCHHSVSGPFCIDWVKHCDGEKDCSLGEDEANCKISESKYLLCENQKQAVTKDQWCNGETDCTDESDEKYCN